MKTKQSLTQKAAELGTKAFNDKKVCIPVQDKDLMNLIKDNRDQIGTKVGSSTFMFKAWSDAWMKSHHQSTSNFFDEVNKNCLPPGLLVELEVSNLTALRSK